MKIGSLELNGYVYIPPMAGVTDLAFRKVVRIFDKDTLLSTEMISSKALLYSSENPKRMKLSADEHPVGIQLFGHEPDVMAKAAILAEEQGADFIDINMGCPVPKITKGKDGAALMKEPDLAVSIALAIISVVRIPVTVKMRLGWNEYNLNASELAKKLEGVGVCAFTVHGRTREQHYSGKADWDAISKVKHSVLVPVFGNGDIKTPFEALKLIELTGCDGVAIARATMGAPWLSHQINQYLKTKTFNPDPSPSERIDIAKIHLRELILLKGENVAIRESRRHLINYMKGFPHAASLRAEIGKLNSKLEANEFLERLKDKLKDGFPIIADVDHQQFCVSTY